MALPNVIQQANLYESNSKL